MGWDDRNSVAAIPQILPVWPARSTASERRSTPKTAAKDVRVVPDDDVRVVDDEMVITARPVEGRAAKGLAKRVGQNYKKNALVLNISPFSRPSRNPRGDGRFYLARAEVADAGAALGAVARGRRG
jgi:hypothetical protein